jgi:hypothetical protein
MSKEIVVLSIQVAFALIFGYFVASKSNVERPIKGGTVAQVFHYLGAATFVAVAPTVLLNTLVLHIPLLSNVLSALGMLVVAMLCLIVHAVFEAPAITPA